ncbi:hypothetical protein JCM11251_006330 [Rhodosporidiobolus azoricus]
MSATLPLYLQSSATSPASTDQSNSTHLSRPEYPPHSPPSFASVPGLETDSRLSVPTSVHTLHPDARPGVTRRESFRPPLPPKPVLPRKRDSRAGGTGTGSGGVGMERSRSADSAAGAVKGCSPALSDGAASTKSSPGKWMSAMLDGGGYDDEQGRRDEARRSLYILADGVGLGIPSGSRTPGGSRSRASTPILGSSAHLPFPARSKEPPAVPPRPAVSQIPMGKLSSPPLQPTPVFESSSSYSIDNLPTSPSSAPPALSPLLAATTSPQPQFPPSSAHLSTHAPPPPRRTSPLPSSNPSSATSTTPTLAAGGVLNAVGRGLQHAKLKDRFGAGVGFAREWGGKGTRRVQEGWKGLGTSTARADGGAAGGIPNSASSPQLDGGAKLPHSPSLPLSAYPSASSSTTAITTPSSTTTTAPQGGIKLPAIVLGVKVPNVRGVAFGTPLIPLAASTRAPPPPFPTPKSNDEVTGDLSRLYLPAIAFRCLEYLALWGPREEGIYRIPGRSVMVSQLRAMFDAGVGGEVDLREIHPGDLDPHAVASCWKGWLRELPESLLSSTLEPLIDALTVQHLGYSASSSSFLSSTTSNASTVASISGTGVVSGSAGSGASAGEGRAPREYCEALREVFADRMEPENWFLLRAIAYHLARLSAHSDTNKMTLTNLRLILSPTLRLTPGFLQVLVKEREILFSKANEAAKQRQTRASSLSTPPLTQSATFSSSSPSSPAGQQCSRQSSPLLYQRPLSPNLSALSSKSPRQPASSVPVASPHSASNSSDKSWLVVDGPSPLPLSHSSVEPRASEDAGRLSPTFAPVSISPEPLSPPPLSSSSSTSFPPTQLLRQRERSSPQTPIADRFASTPSSISASSSTTTLPSGLSKAASNGALRGRSPSNSSSTKPVFIPSRDRANGAGAGGFFGAREVPRKASLTPSVEAEATSKGKERERERPTLDGVKVEAGRFSGWGEAFGSPADVCALGGIDDRGVEEEEQERLASGALELDAATAFAFSAAGESAREGRRSSSASLDGSGSVRSLRRQRERRSSSASSSASSVSTGAGSGTGTGRPTKMDLTLPMPVGIGLGFSSGGWGEGDEEERVEKLRREARGQVKAAAGGDGEEEGGAAWGLLTVEERKKFFGG